ncbi:Hypothetical protein, putative [Bodo saltans]|uniref:Uncharacterized protein n=1 Tax=Bodo saltans TaxID=75058 RepID=A0A0S4JUT5_BODSA|nr:Hypothetical protein, putative [Bodo saltans]|eukprot:CUG93151.1 Hypothetical protein, putative [Bodo saltans]
MSSSLLPSEQQQQQLPKRVHPLENLFSVVSASLHRMDDILLSTIPFRPTGDGAKPAQHHNALLRMAPTTTTTDDEHDAQHSTTLSLIPADDSAPPRRRVASNAPNVVQRGKASQHANHAAASGSNTATATAAGKAPAKAGGIPSRHGSAPAPGWRSVSGARPAAPSAVPASQQQPNQQQAKFVRLLSGRSVPSTSSEYHQGYKRAATGGQQPFSAQAVRKGFLLRLVPASNNNNTTNRGKSDALPPPLTSPTSTTVKSTVSGFTSTSNNNSNNQSKKDLTQYRTAKVLSPVERALLTQPYVASAAMMTGGGGESPPPAAPLLAPGSLSGPTAPPAAALSNSSQQRGTTLSLGVQRHLFGSTASSATAGGKSRGKSIQVPPAATCASSVSMTSTQWTGGGRGGVAHSGSAGTIGNGTQSATQHRTDYLASAVTHSWLSKTHSKGYLMSIIGGNQYRGLSGIAGLSTAQHHNVPSSKPVSPRKYSRMGSGASQGIFSAPSAASTAAGEQHHKQQPHTLVDDDGHADLLSTCSALGWTLDDMGNFHDKSGAMPPPVRSYSHHFSLTQNHMPVGSDISRCAVLLNRIDEELGKVRNALGDDDELANTTASAQQQQAAAKFGFTTTTATSSSHGANSTIHNNNNNQRVGFTGSRKYVQGSIFERLASVGTEAHPLSTADPASLLAPYQRVLSAGQGGSMQPQNGSNSHASGAVMANHNVSHKLPPASSVAASAVAEPANARWVGGLRNEVHAPSGAAASASKRNNNPKQSTSHQRPTSTKTETPPTSIWGRLYAIAEKKQTTSIPPASAVHHHIIQPKSNANHSKEPATAQHAAKRSGPAAAGATTTVASAALFHRLYEDTRTKEETRIRKAQEAEAANQERFRREREAIFNRVNRFRENQQFKATGVVHTNTHHQGFSSPSHQQVPSQPQQQPVRSTSPYAVGGAPPLSPMHTTGMFIPSSTSMAAVSPLPSSMPSPQKQQQLRHNAHSWHRAVSSAGGADSHLWHINDDDLIPASSVEGSPLNRGTIGSGGDITAPPSSMFLPGVASSQPHVPMVKYTSKTLPASASHHSRSGFDTSLNDSSASVLLHTTTSGGNLLGASALGAAQPRRSAKVSSTTSPNLRPVTAQAVSHGDANDDNDDGSPLLAASFVLTPRGTWQRKPSLTALTAAAVAAPQQQTSSTTPNPTVIGVGFKTAPMPHKPQQQQQPKKAPTSPLAHSANAVVVSTASRTPTPPAATVSAVQPLENNNTRDQQQTTTTGDFIPIYQSIGSDQLGRSSSAVSGDGGAVGGGPGSRRNSRNGSTAFHIRTSSYVAPSPQQPTLSAGAPLPGAAETSGTVSPFQLQSYNRRATIAPAAPAAGPAGDHRRDASDEYEEVQDRRISGGGGQGLLGLSWSHHPHSNAEESPKNLSKNLTVAIPPSDHHNEEGELVEHMEKRPMVAKLDFSKLHNRRKL